MKEYDETEALNHIKQYLAERGHNNIDEDLIVEAVDAIWDAYDELDLEDIDFDENADEQTIIAQEQAERQQVIDYMAKQLRRLPLDSDIIAMIYDAEVEYEDTLF